MRSLSARGGLLWLVQPLLRACLWTIAFCIGYRLQVNLEHHHVGPTELAYFLAACAFAFGAAWPRPLRRDLIDDTQRTSVSARTDRWVAVVVPLCVLGAAAVLGVFFRTHDLNSRPTGIWYDEAQNGLIARGILHGQFPPMFIGRDTQLPSAFFYVYALSAKVMGEGILSLRVISTIGGLAALPLMFLLARELFGTRTGVLATFLLAVMRWHVNFSRFGVTNIFSSFFVLGTVYFFVRGLRRGPLWNFVVSGVFVGLTPYAGFYGVFVPIVMGLYWLHAGIFERVLTYRRHLAAVAIVAAAALTVYSPVALWGLRHREEYLSRPGTASIFKGKTPDQAFHAVVKSTRKHLLMFNSSGDKNGRHNLPGAPMLDRFTGILFLLGVGLALVRLRRSGHFLLLVWVAVFLQNGIWSVDFEAPQAFRSSVVTPAVAGLAALPLAALWGIAARSRTPRQATDARVRSAYALTQEWGLRASVTAGISVLLALIAYSNYDMYFNKQLNDPRVWRAFNTDITLVARDMKDAEGDHKILISSLFSSPVINYVDPAAGNLSRYQLDLLRDVPAGDGRPTVVLLDATKQAYVDWITRLYPGAEVSTVAPPGDHEQPLVYKIVIPLESVEELQGLQGSYARPGDLPVTRRETKLDFDWSSQPPPVPVPFHAHWSGAIRFPAYKSHVLDVVAPGAITLRLDGREVGSGKDRVEYAATMYRGVHTISIDADVERPGRVALLDEYAPIDAGNLFSGSTIDTRHGLIATFYRGDNFLGNPLLQELDPFVGFRYHAELSFGSPFSTTWKGHLDVPAADTYTFSLEPFDEASLIIDDQTIIDFPGKKDTAVALQAGQHDIEIRFKNRSGYATIFLRWRRPGGEPELVSSDRLSP